MTRQSRLVLVSRRLTISIGNWNIGMELQNKRQSVLVDGNGDDILSILTCQEEGGKRLLCYLDTILGSSFNVDSGSILGNGAATSTGDHGKVEMERFLFPPDFKFKMLNPDGTEMDEDEVNDFMERMAEQEQGHEEAAMLKTEAEL